MTTLTIGDITLLLAHIDRQGGSRRERERAVVAEMITMLFGSEARLEHTPLGAPYVAGGPHISVSHSAHYAAVAACDDSPIGIDIEEDRPGQLERVAPRVMTPEELAAYDGRLLEAWTIKEAAFKAAGKDLADLRLVNILPPGKASVDGVELSVVLSEAIANEPKCHISVVRCENPH